MVVSQSPGETSPTAGNRAPESVGAWVNDPQHPAYHNLTVSEIFGPTIQGEGASTGHHCVFLRLGGCNLTCTWCDTAYTWDWKQYDPRVELRRMSVAEVAYELVALGPTNMLVISGGEPLLQGQALGHLLTDYLIDTAGWERIEIETNGTRVPAPALMVDPRVFFNVSPKLPHSGNARPLAMITHVLEAFAQHPRAVFKFVVHEFDDLALIDTFATAYMVHPQRIWVMPEGVAPGLVRARARALAPKVIPMGWNLSGRAHLDLFGNKRAH